MAITYVSGTLTSLNVNTDAHIVDMENEIFFLDPQASPFTIFLNKAGKEKAKNREVKCLEWRTKQYIVTSPGISAASGDTGTILYVATGGSAALYCEVNDVIYFPSWGSAVKGEHILVTAVGSAGTTTLTRAYGAGEDVAASTAVAKGYILADVNDEGGAKRAPLVVKTDTVTNYTQIMRTLSSITNTEMAISSYGGDIRKNSQRHMGIEHQLKKERAFLYGKNVTAAVTARGMKGIRPFIKTNTYDMTGATAGDVRSKMQLNLLKPAFDHSSSARKLMLAGSYWINALDSIAMNKVQLTENINFYGLRLLNQVTPYGELVVAYHRQLAADECIIIDLQYVKEAFLRALSLKLDIQTPGTDSVDDEYIEETTIRVKLEECHAFGYDMPSTV